MASVSLSKHFTVLTAILLICGLVVVLITIQERRNEEQNSRHKKSVSAQKRASDCTLDPCQNGGTCTDDGSGVHTCTCASGYNGPNCDQNIDECVSSPCQQHGTCQDAINAYTCVCVAGYTGTNCDTDIDNCNPNPCHNGGTCTDGVNTYTCQCVTDYTGTNCDTATTPAPITPPPTMPVPLGHHCDNVTKPCHNQNMTCTGKNICECTEGYYRHNDTTCLERKKVDETCTIKTEENNECTLGAMCTSALQCECETENYYEDDSHSICKPRRGETEDCTHSQQCIRNAECPNSPTTTQATTSTPAPAVHCRCEQNYYYNETGFKKCLPKLAPGVSCVDNDHCVDGATCDKQSNVCQCNSSTYEFNHTCRVRQILQGECDDTIPNQCLINGVCLDGRCQCDDHSFRKGDDCNATIAVGNSCDYFNREERQCESDTKCVFRYWDDGPVCGCDIDHFFNGHVCQPRALAGDPCPYDPNYLHDSLRLKIEHQCVDNAECSSRLICECKSTHYQRGQHCPPRIEVYGTCDPWANYYHQCIDHHDCVHGRCVPS